LLSSQPINPLIYQLQYDNFLTAADIMESLNNDRSATFGSIIHLLKLGKPITKTSSVSMHSITPYRTYSQFSGKLPICIVRWLENGSYKDPGIIQGHTWPYTVAKTDLLTISPVGEERTLTLVLSALIWIVQAKNERKNVVIYTPTVESVVRIRTFVGFVYDILAKNDIPIHFTSLLLVEQPVYASKEMNPQRLLFLQNCEYVIFDAFDEIIQLGFVDKCTDTLETICDGALFADEVCLHIFSAELSAYETLVSKMFLKNHHTFNISDVKQMPQSKIRHGFSNVRQYLAPNVKSQTPKLLLELVKEILRIDKTKSYVIVIYTQEEYTLAAFNNMRPQITAPVFLRRNLDNDHQDNVFWNDFNSYEKAVLFTSDAASNLKGKFANLNW
jgi:superfamily II DNA/RNA helicase